LCDFARLYRELEMKVKTNVRAGKQGRSGGTDNNPKPESPETPETPSIPPISRCVGI
jgi:hypothetical protein